MVKSKWNDISVGDFFISTVELEDGMHLYQKINSAKTNGYNAVLINTGELCNLYIPSDSSTNFQKVTATFEIQTETK